MNEKEETHMKWKAICFIQLLHKMKNKYKIQKEIKKTRK